MKAKHPEQTARLQATLPEDIGGDRPF